MQDLPFWGISPLIHLRGLITIEWSLGDILSHLIWPLTFTQEKNMLLIKMRNSLVSIIVYPHVGCGEGLKVSFVASSIEENLLHRKFKIQKTHMPRQKE